MILVSFAVTSRSCFFLLSEYVANGNQGENFPKLLRTLLNLTLRDHAQCPIRFLSVLFIRSNRHVPLVQWAPGPGEGHREAPAARMRKSITAVCPLTAECGQMPSL